MFLTRVIVLAIATAFVTPLLAEQATSDQTSGDTMQILREKIKTDKKLLVSANMDLNASESKAFWPIYESYQKELKAINDRLAQLILSYAESYRNNTLTNEKATKLIAESIAVEKAETKLKSDYLPKLSKVLPGKKVARYFQIENKIRAAVKAELAEQIPLVE
jgi:hypothetical protein